MFCFVGLSCCFFIISCRLQWRTAYIFFFTRTKRQDDSRAFSWLRFVHLTLYSHSLSYHFSIMCTRVTGGMMMHRGQLQWWSIITRVATYAKRATTHKYLRGGDNFCSSAAYNNFNTISCGLQSRAANNRINAVIANAVQRSVRKP